MTDAIRAAIEASREREKTPLHPTLFSDWDEESLRVAYLNGGLARAVYDLQCRYTGPKHDEVSVRLVEDAIRVATRIHEPRFRDALNVAVYRLGEYAAGRCNVPAWAEQSLKDIAAILEGRAGGGGT
jgi:hypothetical protein